MDTERRLERAIVLQLLRDDHEEPWFLDELVRELDAPASSVEQALARLSGDGVVRLSGTEVSAAHAARCLNELALIAI